MNTNFFDNAINQRLMGLHTLYLAKVIRVNKNPSNVIISANIQPLAMIKAYGEKAKQQAILENVPILNHAKSGLTVGKVVCCACMERDITQTKYGTVALPSNRHHSISDSIIIGILEV